MSIAHDSLPNSSVSASSRQDWIPSRARRGKTGAHRDRAEEAAVKCDRGGIFTRGSDSPRRAAQTCSTRELAASEDSAAGTQAACSASEDSAAGTQAACSASEDSAAGTQARPTRNLTESVSRRSSSSQTYSSWSRARVLQRRPDRTQMAAGPRCRWCAQGRSILRR